MLMAMTRTDGSLITAVPTTDFGFWLRDRCLERNWETYRQVAEYTEVSHAQIRSYVVEGAHPRPPTTRRLAKALRFDERELARIVALSEVVAGGQQAPNGSTTASAVRGIQGSREKAGDRRPTERQAQLLANVAHALLTGNVTEAHERHLDDFVREVDAWHGPDRDGRDDAGGGDSSGDRGPG